MSRAGSIAVAIVGLLLFVPGVALLIYTFLDLKPADVTTALTPFVTIPLDSVGRQALTSMRFVIPKGDARIHHYFGSFIEAADCLLSGRFEDGNRRLPTRKAGSDRSVHSALRL